LFNKKPVDTGTDRRTMVYISPLLASQRLRKASMPSTACTLSDRKGQTPEVKLYSLITAARCAQMQRWGGHKHVASAFPLPFKGDRTGAVLSRRATAQNRLVVEKSESRQTQVCLLLFVLKTQA